MDAKTILRTLLGQTKTSLRNNEDETNQIYQQIADLQQRLNQLAEQKFTLRGKEQAYNEMLTVMEKTEAAPPPAVETATTE